MLEPFIFYFKLDMQNTNTNTNKTKLKLLNPQYLLSCDLINKYNLLSTYKEPKIVKIILSLSLKEIQRVSYSYETDEAVSSDLQIKTFLFFYLTLGSAPYVTFQSVKTTKGTRYKNDGDFLLQATISNGDRISAFLSILSMENKRLMETSDFRLFKAEFLSKVQTNLSKMSCNMKIPGDFFFDAKYFFSSKFQDLNLSKIEISTSIIIENIPKNCNIVNAVRNSEFICPIGYVK